MCFVSIAGITTSTGPYRALDLLPPDGHIGLNQATTTQLLRRRDLLGGLIHEYEAAA